MKALPCPTCALHVKPVRVTYGLPTLEAEQDAADGRIVLGGCDPTFGPEFVCPECGSEIDPDGVVASRVASRAPASEAPKPAEG